MRGLSSVAATVAVPFRTRKMYALSLGIAPALNGDIA